MMAATDPNRLMDAADAIRANWGDTGRTLGELRLLCIKFTEVELTEALAFLIRADLLPEKRRATKQ